MSRLLPIVEGQADIQAISLLIQKVLKANQHYDVRVLPPHRRGEYPAIVKNFDNYFLAALKENAAILWVMDFDCDHCQCPGEEADKLLAKAASLRPNWPFKVAFMVKEYETLFLADETATRSVLTRLSENDPFPANPETVRAAKEWLSRRLPSGMAYKEMVHQVKITNALDLGRLRNSSASFAHFERSVLALVSAPIPS